MNVTMDYPTFPDPSLSRFELAAARREWARWRYEVCGWSQDRIGKELGVGQDTISEALAKIAPRPVRRAVPKAERLGPEVERLYVGEKLTILAVAARLKTSARTVQQALALRGVTIRPKGPYVPRATNWKPTDDRIRRAYRGGLRSMAEIARLTGLDPGLVRRALDRMGLSRVAISNRKATHGTKNEPKVPARFVRRVKGGLYQGRGFLNKEIWNLGLHRPADYPGGAEEAAAAASRAGAMFKQLLTPDRTPWDVIQEMKTIVVDGRPMVPPDVLPKHVVRLTDGSYSARSGSIRLPSTHSDPWAAHVAMRALLGK